MTAGYFSAIKRVQCTFAEPTDAQNSYVVKAWPEFEIMPKEAIRAMFVKDIKAYLFPKARFYPRPATLLADFNVETEQWALIMEDASTFAEQKVHEAELNLDEVLQKVPSLVETAVAAKVTMQQSSKRSGLASGLPKTTWRRTARSCRAGRSYSTR